MKELIELITHTLSLIPEKYFTDRIQADESIYIRLDGRGYYLKHERQKLKNSKGIEIPTYEVQPTQIKATRDETIKGIRNGMQQRQLYLKEYFQNRRLTAPSVKRPIEGHER